MAILLNTLLTLKLIDQELKAVDTAEKNTDVTSKFKVLNSLSHTCVFVVKTGHNPTQTNPLGLFPLLLSTPLSRGKS